MRVGGNNERKGDICAAAFFADLPGPESAPDGLTHSHFLVRTDEIGSPQRLFENHSQKLCSANSRARRRRVGGLTASSGNSGNRGYPVAGMG
jgi:hypothetical protein